MSLTAGWNPSRGLRTRKFTVQVGNLQFNGKQSLSGKSVTSFAQKGSHAQSDRRAYRMQRWHSSHSSTPACILHRLAFALRKGSLLSDFDTAATLLYWRPSALESGLRTRPHFASARPCLFLLLPTLPFRAPGSGVSFWAASCRSDSLR